MTRGPHGPRFVRFAAAMEAAHAAKAPQLTLYRDGPTEGVPPASGALQRPVIRWLGIGGCVVLLGLLLLTLLTQPIGAALERLVGPGSGSRQDRTVAAARIDPAPPAPPGASEAPPMAAAPVVDHPPAPFPPVPSFRQRTTEP